MSFCSMRRSRCAEPACLGVQLLYISYKLLLIRPERTALSLKTSQCTLTVLCKDGCQHRQLQACKQLLPKEEEVKGRRESHKHTAHFKLCRIVSFSSMRQRCLAMSFCCRPLSGRPV